MHWYTTCNIVSPLRIVHPLTESKTQSPCRRGIKPFDTKSCKASHEWEAISVLSCTFHVPQGYEHYKEKTW